MRKASKLTCFLGGLSVSEWPKDPLTQSIRVNKSVTRAPRHSTVELQRQKQLLGVASSTRAGLRLKFFEQAVEGH